MVSSDGLPPAIHCEEYAKLTRDLRRRSDESNHWSSHENSHGVEFAIRDEDRVTSGVRRTVGARKEVIVSAGAINSPKLLLLSGIGPKGGTGETRCKKYWHSYSYKEWTQTVSTLFAHPMIRTFELATSWKQADQTSPNLACIYSIEIT